MEDIISVLAVKKTLKETKINNFPRTFQRIEVIGHAATPNSREKANVENQAEMHLLAREATRVIKWWYK